MSILADMYMEREIWAKQQKRKAAGFRILKNISYFALICILFLFRTEILGLLQNL